MGSKARSCVPSDRDGASETKELDSVVSQVASARKNTNTNNTTAAAAVPARHNPMAMDLQLQLSMESSRQQPNNTSESFPAGAFSTSDQRIQSSCFPSANDEATAVVGLGGVSATRIDDASMWQAKGGGRAVGETEAGGLEGRSREPAAHTSGRIEGRNGHQVNYATTAPVGTAASGRDKDVCSGEGTPSDDGAGEQNNSWELSGGGGAAAGGDKGGAMVGAQSSAQASDEDPSGMDERKQKRMLSNRESARRSRLRKQQHLDELRGQVTQLRAENTEMLKNFNVASRHYMQLTEENRVLRSHAMDLSRRLQRLHHAAAAEGHPVGHDLGLSLAHMESSLPLPLALGSLAGHTHASGQMLPPSMHYPQMLSPPGSMGQLHRPWPLK
eukprot:TRINITY_DN3771_c0_g1_i1.p1 TRINITY_DN3771_c0_g1~~TRINITY_DN3771_c0_g1_i1.p1  ORF type:complete len:386 (+),score=60.65 TRINITY_DN3771_c0_g1_i1:197-1354(+)